MAVFFEMDCPGCGGPVRWVGATADRPKCPTCGYRATDSEVATDDAEVERFREFLGRRKSRKASGEKPNDADRAYMLGE